MRTIIFATGNEHKMVEIRMILEGLGARILSQKEAGIKVDVVEDGSTFEENALIKAGEIARAAAQIPEYQDAVVLADDSGLEIDYLNKEPGIYSARYLGEDTPYAVKNRSIIERLKEAGGQERSARFVCNIAAMLPDGQVLHTEAVMEGLIAGEPAGEGGFGYDPILYLPEFGKTSAEITMDQKNEISHRGKALRAMKEALEGVLK